MRFSTVHIAVTAILVAAVSITIATAMLRPVVWRRTLAVPVVAGLATFGWRLAANVDALNTDGMPWVSANDALAGVVTYIALDGYAALRPPTSPPRFRQLQVAVAVVAVAVNVIAI